MCVCVCARTCVWCTGVYEEAACRMLLPDTLLVQPVCYLPGTGVWGPGSADLCVGAVFMWLGLGTEALFCAAGR